MPEFLLRQSGVSAAEIPVLTDRLEVLYKIIHLAQSQVRTRRIVEPTFSCRNFVQVEEEEGEEGNIKKRAEGRIKKFVESDGLVERS